jgi:hypothetical protein
MAIRKTKDVYVVQGNYSQGWEDLTAHDTRKEAIAERKTYDANGNYPHRVISKREKIQQQ